MPAKSTVCLIAKNEAPYLIEWIAYHKLIGFNEIVVYDNNSSDGTEELLRPLERAGEIVYRKWSLGANESPQITAYRDAIKRVKSEWIIFIDADEFLVLHQHYTVNAFLSGFDARPEVTSISMNWRIFGDSGLEVRDDRPVTERFTLAAPDDFPVHRHLKTFSRVGHIGAIVNMHVCQTDGLHVHPSGQPLAMTDWGLSDAIELSVAQVNHYYTKTYDEYQDKRGRGQADAAETSELKYTWYHDDAFRGHNRNDVPDLSITKNLDSIKREIHRLKNL